MFSKVMRAQKVMSCRMNDGTLAVVSENPAFIEKV